jgi:hypothetical protein
MWVKKTLLREEWNTRRTREVGKLSTNNTYESRASKLVCDQFYIVVSGLDGEVYEKRVVQVR